MMSQEQNDLITRTSRKDPGLRGPATLMVVLLFAQLLTGLTTIFFQWPLLIAVLHNGGAAGLVLAGVTLLVRLSRSGSTVVRS